MPLIKENENENESENENDAETTTSNQSDSDEQEQEQQHLYPYQPHLYHPFAAPPIPFMNNTQFSLAPIVNTKEEEEDKKHIIVDALSFPPLPTNLTTNTNTNANTNTNTNTTQLNSSFAQQQVSSDDDMDVALMPNY
eukprot:TRINITY_DN5967_c0_g1_i1.p1 TRINITY_DN5967_c0_g1~~TRINITY_DN5967_c0_g1_i1.p1  ORF type:complete len:145 (-),score=26.67 TRINITY_DN5967_c0_g1_i1:84-497(-)